MSLSSYPAGFRGGALIKGYPQFDQVDGNVFFVDSGTGGAGNPGTFTQPLATVQQGINKCANSNNDTVVVFAGHSEVLTAQIDANKVGVTVIGLGEGNAKPALQSNATTMDTIDISAANVTIANIFFNFPGASGDGATADINVDAAGAKLLHCSHLGSTTALNKESFVTVTANGDDLIIDGMRGYNSVVDMASGIELAAAARVEIKNCVVIAKTTIGYTVGALDDTGICTQLDIHDCVFGNGKLATAVVTFASNSVGSMYDCGVNGLHGTIASNLLTGTGVDFFEVYVCDNAQKNGLLIPTIDA